MRPEVRTRVMRSIRGRDTRPELLVRSFLHRAGLRFRLHGRGLAGRPDVVLPRHRTVVFVHGCFWHQHPGCRLARRPPGNAAYWGPKLDGNVARDARNLEALAALGWRLAVIWECEVGPARLEALAAWIRSARGEGF